jgi:hypothetical protein
MLFGSPPGARSFESQAHPGSEKALFGMKANVLPTMIWLMRTSSMPPEAVTVGPLFKPSSSLWPVVITLAPLVPRRSGGPRRPHDETTIHPLGGVLARR